MRIGKNSLLGLLVVSIVLLLNACVVEVKHNPYGYTPPHTTSSFAYWYYYPNSHVYYNIAEHYYYYRYGQRWIKARALPAGWVLNNGYRVRLKIAGSPYRQHAHHERQYPPRQRSANDPAKRRHGDDRGMHQGKDHGKEHGLFVKLPRLMTGPHNQQNKPERTNQGKGQNKGRQSEHAARGKELEKRHQPEHANRGKGPDEQHQLVHARAIGHMAPAKPHSGKFHGKPAKKASAVARGHGNHDKGGSQNAKRPMAHQQPQELQAKARHRQGSVKHASDGIVKAKSSASHQQRAGNAKHSHDAVMHKTADKTKMKPTGGHQSAQAQAHGNKSAGNHEQSQKTAGMTSPRNKQQAAKHHKASDKKQQAGKNKVGKKVADKDQKGAKAEKTLAANQEGSDPVEEKPGNGKGHKH